MFISTLLCPLVHCYVLTSKRYCDIVIYKANIYLVTQITKIHFSYIFGLTPRFRTHASQIPRNSLSVQSNKGVFCYVNEMVFVIPPRDKGWLPGEPAIGLEGQNFQSLSHPSTQGEERGWRLSQFLVAKDLINHAYIIKSP